MSDSGERVVFKNISLYLTGRPTIEGSVYIEWTEIGAWMHFVQDGVESPSPFTGPFILTPLLDPYICNEGHHMFDLTFYSEATVIEEPPRLCFHDPTQELGISLNFATKEAFQECFNYIKREMTVISPGLPGFYQIKRNCPEPSYGVPNFQENKQKLKQSLINDQRKLGENLLLDDHSQLIEKITNMIGVYAVTSSKENLPKASVEQLTQAMSSSKADVKKLLRQYTVPDAMKADVWAYLIGLAPLNNLNPELIKQYTRIKTQWKTTSQSQYVRSKLIRERLSACIDYVNANKQAFLSVAVSDTSVLTVAFNVFMSVSQVYQFASDHKDTLKNVFRVFLWLFVKDITKDDKGGQLFVGSNGVTMDIESLETVIFWSILFIMEGGEMRRMMETPESELAHLVQPISDFIFLAHPSMFKHLHTTGVNYSKIAPLVMNHLSTLLPLCDCIDTWFAALTAPCFIEFIEYIIISCLFFNFPNMISREQNSDQDLKAIIQQSFEFVGHRYLIIASFVLSERSEELVSEMIRSIRL